MHIKTWHVEVFVYEEDDDTSARAVLHSSSPRHLEGHGSSRRKPADARIPEIGDEVAVGRALHSLAEQLLGVAAGDIEAIEQHPVHVSVDDPPARVPAQERAD